MYVQVAPSIEMESKHALKCLHLLRWIENIQEKELLRKYKKMANIFGYPCEDNTKYSQLKFNNGRRAYYEPFVVQYA